MKPFYFRNDDVAERFFARIDRIVDSIDKNREIYCFGYSSINIMAIGHLCEKYPDRTVCGFVDNNSSLYSLSSKDGRESFRIQPVSVLNGMADKAAVLISSMHYESMAQQLRGMGFVDQIGIFHVTDLTEEHNDCDLADREGYEEISLRDVKLLEIDMLRYFKTVCEENGIRYYLAYGTLLGAVRDQGIMPWDDDIDLYVWGEDIERLAELINGKGKYQLLYYGNCKEFSSDPAWMINPRFIEDRNMLPKVYTSGVCFDVFPLWNQPGNEAKDDFISDYKILEQAEYEALGRKRGLQNAINRRIEFLSGFSDESENVGCMHWAYSSEMLKREWFNGCASVMLEGDSFSAPAGYEAYLTNRFGDNYMSPPDLKKEKPRHRSKYYVNRDPEYIGDGAELKRERQMLAESKLRYESKPDETMIQEFSYPQEWIERTRDTDGSRKKIILFDTGAGAVLHYGREMLEKLEDSIKVFIDNKATISILWQTRGNDEAVIEDPELRRRYHVIVDHFISSGVGVYDVSSNYERAVNFCDAYYGDGGVVANLCRDAGKPVMIQNINILSST